MSNLILFLKECKSEFDKVIWPDKEQVFKSTLVVLYTVLFFSIFLFLADLTFVKLLTWFWNL